jgi:hypothetical protein
MHVMVAIPDKTRGEHLVPATTERDADIADLRVAAELRCMLSSALPRRIMVMPRLP